MVREKIDKSACWSLPRYDLFVSFLSSLDVNEGTILSGRMVPHDEKNAGM